MKLFIFGDIHGDFDVLKTLIQKKADLFICHGDLTDLGQGLDQAAKILKPLGQRLWLMPGNNETEEQIKRLCQEYGFVNFHGQIKQKGPYVFAGLGFSTPTPFKTPGEINEVKYAQSLKKFVGHENLCLFCHNPPKESQLDVLANGVHVGGQSLREFIEKEKPLYCFCGHLHENEGKIQRLGQTTCFNVGKKGLMIWL